MLALAPDPSAQRAAQALASSRSWPLTGAAEPAALWGECRGSATAPYRTVVDLSGPAYRCSCPSRKFPCKHALALLLLWSDGCVSHQTDEPPDWAASWIAAQMAQAQAKADDAKELAGPAAAHPKTAHPQLAHPQVALRRAEQREARVATGLVSRSGDA